MAEPQGNTDTAKPFARTVHIDTSLQIEQQKARALADPVRAALARYVFTSTSSYARKEFKRAWLQDLNLIYKAAEGCAHIGEVYVKLGKAFYHPTSKRRLSRSLDAISAFLEPHPGMPVGVAVIRLREHLANMILLSYLKWERAVTHEYHGTECVRATERPRRSGQAIDVTVRKCSPTKVQCSVHKFFQRHQESFNKIASAIGARGESASEELRRIAVTIRSASKDPLHLCDSKNCSAMADALIAVDGIQTDHFAANNDKEWQTISSALSKPLINPVREAKAAKLAE